MSRASKQIECLIRLDELVASYDSILEFMRAEDLISRDEVRAVLTSSEVPKAIQTRLDALSKTNKIQLLEYTWEVLPVERIKIVIITDRNNKEFSYNY